MTVENRRCFVSGGAGFIGTNLTARLLDAGAAEVTLYDDFSTGRRAHVARYADDPRVRVVEGKIEDEAALADALRGHDIVFHLASNADIARAVREPDIDFRLGTLLTQRVLEAMRVTGVSSIVFTSGSGVYGDVEPVPTPEDYARMVPISTYGASKLASESLISAYSYMFGMRGLVFRMANVVGRFQTHGVAYDFLRRLAADPSRLLILGDGRQTKPYVHVDDVIDAYLSVESAHASGYARYNLGTEDGVSVREIADLCVEALGLRDVPYEFTGGSRGWKGDVPVYRLDCARIRATGWRPRRESREALAASIAAMREDLASGLFA